MPVSKKELVETLRQTVLDLSGPILLRKTQEITLNSTMNMMHRSEPNSIRGCPLNSRNAEAPAAKKKPNAADKTNRVVIRNNRASLPLGGRETDVAAEAAFRFRRSFQTSKSIGKTKPLIKAISIFSVTA